MAGLILLVGACNGANPARSPGAPRLPQPGAPTFADPQSGAPIAGTILALDFGRVRLGAVERREVAVRNSGPSALTITAFRPSDGVPDAFAYPAGTLTVVPNKQVAFPVTFRPAVAGTVSGSLHLVIENGDPATALTLQLRGTGYHGESPELDLAPPALDFGDVELTTSALRRLTVANVGVDVPGTASDNLRFAVVGDGGRLVETAPEITGPDAADFSLEWPPTGYGIAGLSEGETVDLRVHLNPSATGLKQATLVLYSNDSARARVEVALWGNGVPLAPCILDVRPTALAFGSVAAGRESTRAFAIVNQNPNPARVCRIANLDLSPNTKARGTFTLVDGPVRDASIPGAGGSLPVRVRFAPREAGAYSGELALDALTPAPATLQVPLFGVGHSECLMISPSELDFGTVGVTCRSRELQLTLYNTCSSAVVVASADLQQGPMSEFAITQKPAFPLTIPGGKVVDFGLVYRSVDIGDDTASLIVSALGASEPRVVPIQARGATDPAQTDVFSQSDTPKIDVLFVVDNSSSMADKQAVLATNLGAFIQYAVDQRVDYHLAVTTTDVTSTGAAGRLLPLSGPSPRVITRTTPQPEEAFLRNATVGTAGSETESLLRPGYLALTNPLVQNHNDGFFRDEAKLAIIAISDAADQDPLTTPVSFYENFFLNLRGAKRRNDFTFSAIIPTASQAPEGCSYDTPTAGLDLRCQELAQRTGGVVQDICEPRWFDHLESLASHVFGLRTIFFLSNIPDLSVSPDPIVISVDNLPCEQYDAKGGQRWEYSSTLNAVVFDRLATPDAGSTLSISYHVACL